MDVLSLVRKATSSGSQVQYENKYYIFDGDKANKVHESTPTNFKRTLIKSKLIFTCV